MILAPSRSGGELRGDITRAITEKSAKLARYRDRGHPTILLLDTDDLSLINEAIVANAFEEAVRECDHGAINEIFAFHEVADFHFIQPLKFGGVIPPDWRWSTSFSARKACSSSASRIAVLLASKISPLRGASPMGERRVAR